MFNFNNPYILHVKYIRLIRCFLLLFFVNTELMAQLNGSLSHRVNIDSTVTFTYIDSSAHRVILESDCLLPREDHSFAGRQNRCPMHQVSPSVWQLTTPRNLKPELYMFRLFADGEQIINLPNYDWVWKRNKKKHIFLIKGSEQADLYASSPLSGHLDTISFIGETGNRFYAMVYTPANMVDTIAYPVLYLFHGINGNQYDWVGQGRLSQIMDNLIHQKQIQPIIVVMPYCLLSTPKFEEHVKATNVGNYSEILSGKFEEHFYEIYDYIQSHYKTRSVGLAIAGLSCGARQAVNIAHKNPNVFSYVGLFSPVVSRKQLPPERYNIKYWVGACLDDWMFYDDAQRFVRGLEKNAIQPMYVENEGGHTFINWRKFISEFIQWAYPIDSTKLNE